jgi:uncharacterized protein YbcI
MLGSSTSARDPLLAISSRMVRLYKDTFGRGPTRARASFAGSAALVVVLEHTLTVAERNMVEMGAHQRLREMRLFTQSALEQEARAIVEEVLRRPTTAYITGLDPQHDVAIQFFSLGPANGSRESR